MAQPFSKQLHVGWGDLDSNAHMKNTAYLDKSGDIRMMYFQEHGFSMREFEARRLGPIVMRDDIEYYRELRLLDSVTVTMSLSGLSSDASRFRIQNEFFRDDGKLVARVTSTGGWFDLEARKLTRPPSELEQAFRSLGQTDNFEILPSSLK